MAVSSALDARKSRGRLADVPARYRERVLAALPGQVERIVLFGSRARGEPHEDSDWDFAVYLDHAPGEAERETLRAIGSEIGQGFDAEIQSHAFASQAWLATTELACNIRDLGLIIYGPDHAPMIERPARQHVRDALDKAERFAEQAAQAVPAAYETVIHNSYYAMFHAARAALLAVEGTASTKHGRVVETFRRMLSKRRLGAVAADHALTLTKAYEPRAKADYDNVDLTEAGRQLRSRVAPFLTFCRKLVKQRADEG